GITRESFREPPCFLFADRITVLDPEDDQLRPVPAGVFPKRADDLSIADRGANAGTCKHGGQLLGYTRQNAIAHRARRSAACPPAALRLRCGRRWCRGPALVAERDRVGCDVAPPGKLDHERNDPGREERIVERQNHRSFHRMPPCRGNRITSAVERFRSQTCGGNRITRIGGVDQSSDGASSTPPLGIAHAKATNGSDATKRLASAGNISRLPQNQSTTT